MAFDAHKNFAVSTVATAPSPTSSGTSLVVAAGQGSRFPAAPFNAVVCPAGTLPDPSNSEIVRVTAISTDTLTITRAQESTSARTIGVGDMIFAGITAKTLTDVEAKAGYALHFFGSGDMSGADSYFFPAGNYSGSFYTETQTSFPALRDGVLKNLFFRTKNSGSPWAAGSTFVITVRVNGVDTALTVTFTGDGSTTMVSDTTHSVAVSAGDLISVKWHNSAGSPTTAQWWGGFELQ